MDKETYLEAAFLPQCFQDSLLLQFSGELADVLIELEERP